MPNANTLFDSKRYLWEVIKNLNTHIGKLDKVGYDNTLFIDSI